MVPNINEREVPYTPDLSPQFTRRFDALTDELVEYPKQLDREVAIKDEIKTVEQNLGDEELSEDRVRYLGVLEVLLDLIEIGFEVRKNAEFKVVRPDLDQYKDDPEKYKEHERAILKNEWEAQFNKQSARDFIRRMEENHRANGSGHVSIENLITDGEDLYESLAPLQDKPQEDIIQGLNTKIQPYIQVAEKGKNCEHTRFDLMDIWRYFRYTWLTPYNTVPGRNINFLIRDGARKYHPVMGIASLASPMMNLTVRDEHIGWLVSPSEDRVKRKNADTTGGHDHIVRKITWDVDPPEGEGELRNTLEERLVRKKRVHKYEEQLPKDERTHENQTRTKRRREWLESEEEWKERVEQICTEARKALEAAIARSVENIRFDDFIDEYDHLTEEQFTHPDEQVFDILAEIEEDAQQVIDNKNDRNPEKLDSWKERSETALFRKKRARTLQKLLRDRKYFEDHTDQSDTEFIIQGLKNETGRRAIKTGMKEIKKRRAGAGMMNIMVCGAIPPYNRILGGKLIGMALTGPKVIDTYRDKYEDTVSKIASSMKGKPVVKSEDVVFYDTTGLFEVGSAQYDRIRIPNDDGKMEYKELGYTKGYGSIQFGPKTLKRLSQVTKFEEERQVVRGRFGEGIAPRMRKIRGGLENCGLDGDLLKHESRRIVYGVDLAENAKAYLRGETDEPAYYWSFDDPEAEQQSIYDYWKERWASKRIQKPEILDRIAEFDKNEFVLSSDEDIEFAQQQLSDFIVENN